MQCIRYTSIILDSLTLQCIRYTSLITDSFILQFIRNISVILDALNFQNIVHFPNTGLHIITMWKLYLPNPAYIHVCTSSSSTTQVNLTIIILMWPITWLIKWLVSRGCWASTWQWYNLRWSEPIYWSMYSWPGVDLEDVRTVNLFYWRAFVGGGGVRVRNVRQIDLYIGF